MRRWRGRRRVLAGQAVPAAAGPAVRAGPAGAAARRDARAARARHAGRGPGGAAAAAADARPGRAVAGRPLARAAGAGQGRHRPGGGRPQGRRPQRQRRAVPQRRALRPAGPCRTGETTLAAHLEPAYGPGDLDLADRGFPSSEAAVTKITAGKHFAWRVSSAWKLRRCGRPLSDGTWKAAITWRGRTVKVRVVEYHMDQVFDPPPGHPLLAGPPPGVSVRVLDDGDGPPGGMCRQPDGTIRVEVSETVTIITSLTDPVAYPAGDIAELYGMRWASELVYLEEKQTLSAGQPVTAATPAGAYRMAAATVAAHQALRIAGAAIAAAIGAEPARISATALRDAVTASIRAGQGSTLPALTSAIGIISRDITAHPLRFVTAWRPGRHYPRYTIKKVRTRKSRHAVPAATRLHLLPLPAGTPEAQPNAPPAV